MSVVIDELVVERSGPWLLVTCDIEVDGRRIRHVGRAIKAAGFSPGEVRDRVVAWLRPQVARRRVPVPGVVPRVPVNVQVSSTDLE